MRFASRSVTLGHAACRAPMHAPGAYAVSDAWDTCHGPERHSQRVHPLLRRQAPSSQCRCCLPAILTTTVHHSVFHMCQYQPAKKSWSSMHTASRNRGYVLSLRRSRRTSAESQHSLAFTAFTTSDTAEVNPCTCRVRWAPVAGSLCRWRCCCCTDHATVSDSAYVCGSLC